MTSTSQRPRSVHAPGALPRRVRVAVIGSGFSGIGTAVRLKQQGVEDFVVLERAGSLGGTWRDNTYPGCACDVPSHLYSFSFATNPAWSHSFSRQPEIRAYLEDVAERFGVLAHLHCDTDVVAGSWDDDALLWRLSTSRGELTADVVVSGCGGLVEPAMPDVPGVGSFAGPAFHSARWDHDVDLTGKRVAVVGTGASAIQFVPALQKAAAHVTVFQRTPPWVVPRIDRERGEAERALYRRVPALQKLARGAVYWYRELNLLAFTGAGRMRAFAESQARKHLESSVADPALRAALTPDYAMGCKRVLISNDYYPALTRDNVTLVSSGVREVTPRGVVDADGREHEVDVVVYGTGFRVMDIPVARCLTGREGRTLAQEWADGGTQAHRGTTVAGSPNLFLLLGPNTALGHSSVVFMIEAQIAYVMDALRTLDAPTRRRPSRSAAGPRRTTTRRSRLSSATPSGTPAAAAPGTATRRAATSPSGPRTPSPSAGRPAGSTPRPTSCGPPPGPARRPEPRPTPEEHRAPPHRRVHRPAGRRSDHRRARPPPGCRARRRQPGARAHPGPTAPAAGP